MKISKLLKTASITALIVASSPSISDDTDIFVGNGSYSEGVQPNILFLLDNSGSMSSTAKDSDGNSTGKTRMEAMKESFSEIITNISGVNVGLMRFNSPGGSVLYPVTDVNKVLSTQSGIQAKPDMITSQDDAIENLTSNTVELEESTLRLGATPATTMTQSSFSYIRHKDDDREEKNTPSYYKVDNDNHSQINIDSSQLNGLRFTDLNIPKGATITSAWLDFRASRNDSSAMTIEIAGQISPNPIRFTGAKADLRNRYLNSVSSNIISWPFTSSDKWKSGNRYNSPDITSIVQEIVNQTNWSPNNAMVFFVRKSSGSGQRAGTLYKKNSSSTQGPNGRNTRLHIKWSKPVPSQDFLTGLRFQQVSVPKGAIIESAFLNFTSTEDYPSDSLKLKVQMENSGNAPAFTDTNGDLSQRSKLFSSVYWEPSESWISDDSVTGPDVTLLLQQIVNKNDWCGNNAVAFFIQPSSLSPKISRSIKSYDSPNREHAELVVKYTIPTNQTLGCENTLWESRINSGEDDAEQKKSSSSVSNSSSTLDLDSDEPTAAIRIELIPVKQGGIIQEAYIELTAKENRDASATLKIQGEASDNAKAFLSQKHNISNRPTTSATLNWTLGEWKKNKVYRSPDLSHIIQEIMNRGQWEAGNSLNLIIKNTNASNNGRPVYSYDSSPGKAIKLVLKIKDGDFTPEQYTVAKHMRDLVNALEPKTYTPIVDTLYETALYLRGEAVDYGQSRELFPQNSSETIDKRYKRVSHIDSYTGGSHSLPSGCQEKDLNDTDCRPEIIQTTPTKPIYKSPITSDCQPTHIILLTDGEANNNHSISRIKNLTGNTTCDTDTNRSGEKCGRSIAHWMANNDMKTNFPNTEHNIFTHTIAFNLSSSSSVQFLKDLAQQGGGSFNTANTSSELTDAFNAILSEVISISSTFTSPGATVNQFNRLTHRDEIYFSLFKPQGTPRWNGNLKRFKLLGNPAVIVDTSNQEAVDKKTGFFKTTAKSFWSTVTDGDDITLGGAAHQIPHQDSRKVFTHLSAQNQKNLTHSSNKVDTTNAYLTKSLLQATDNIERTKMIQWLRGADVFDENNDSDTTDTRHYMADPLHSVPSVATYGGTEANPDMTLFFGTNEGMLHAINASTGKEIFSFIPEELLGNLKILFDNSNLYKHVYGLDGTAVIWSSDKKNNNVIEPAEDHVYLYIGMRRGGRNLYALDVTNRSNPKILWTIKGGEGDFEKLGQTWSKPVKTKIKLNNQEKDVLVFSGGFDPIIDTKPTDRTEVTMGNSLYIVDATTGARLWMASKGTPTQDGLHSPEMHYALAANIDVIDINQDGFADQIYAADIGGQIWRFDVNNAASSATTLVDGGIIADLGAETGANQRRFFFKPDISLISHKGLPRLALAIGTGALNEPHDKIVQNRFYMLFQDDVYHKPSSYQKITELDLTDRTDYNSNTSQAVGAYGWYLKLENDGEKVLSHSITLEGNIAFSTWEPATVTSACSGVSGVGRAYWINAFDASPSTDLNKDSQLTKVDRYRTLSSSTIPPAPRILFPSDGGVIRLDGLENVFDDINILDSLSWQRTYWYEK